MSPDVTVIGGGISGLATAWALRQSGLDVVVLERQTRAGGNAISERFNGFLMEHGPTAIAATVPAVEDFSRDLGLNARRCLLSDRVRQRYLTADGGLKRIPIHALGFVTSDYLSITGRARILMEYLVPRGRQIDNETVGAFCARRFGREFADRVIDPLVGGVYAGRADDMSLAAVFPRLAEMERRYGSVTNGILRSRLRNGRMPGRRLVSWRDGTGSLPSALNASLGEVVRCGVTVTRLRRLAAGYEIDTGEKGRLRTKAIVLATQPHVAGQLLDGLDSEAAGAVAEIAAPPMAVVFLGYRTAMIDHPLDGLGYLSSSNEGRTVNGAQFCSTMFDGRAPAGHAAIACYFGGARAPDLARLPAADLIGLARHELKDLIGARGSPAVARVRHWPVGLPQYRAGHVARVEDIRSAERRSPGLFLTGNYLEGPAVGTCLTMALKTAADVKTFIAKGRGGDVETLENMAAIQ